MPERLTILIEYVDGVFLLQINRLLSEPMGARIGINLLEVSLSQVTMNFKTGLSND